MTQFSIEFDYQSTGSHSGGIENILSAATSTSQNNMLNVYAVNSNGSLSLDLGNNASLNIPEINIMDGEKHTITLTWDSTTGEFKTYDNNTLVATDSIKQGLTIPAGGYFMLGQEQDSYGGGLDASQSMTNAKIGHFSMGYDVVAQADIENGKSVSDASGNLAVDLRILNGELVDTSGNFVPSITGDVTLPEDGTYIFEPHGDVMGDVPIEFDIFDGTDLATATANLFFGYNEAPTASALTAQTDEDSNLVINSLDLLAAANDNDGDALIVTSVEVVNNAGTVIDNQDGTFTFRPAYNLGRAYARG